MELKHFLFEKFNLPEVIVTDLQASGHRKVFRKGEVILRTDNLTKKTFFVEKGLTKLFYYKEGKEITHYFLQENNFITRSENFLTDGREQEKSIYGLASLENDTTIYEIPFAKIEAWAETSVEMNKLIQQILMNILRGFSGRLNNIQFENAQERYEQMLYHQPDIILRAPLGDIASFLGISPQTLSVIRAKIR